ncbi:hypothetical protein E2C01_054730 [Portunus trituberculatus]|uniref:Uncharacterized protein n=1 Tax=Portunus trituberculatus TaxID=210409 RepID=A0A5B7GVS9_PORTR|nr:hypothetical protein [Portunus trituberculatus]
MLAEVAVVISFPSDAPFEDVLLADAFCWELAAVVVVCFEFLLLCRVCVVVWCSVKERCCVVLCRLL